MQKGQFNPPLIYSNAHLQTILPSQFRNINIKPTSSESIPADEGDLLDLDWYHNNKSALVILSHGLEGNSERPYIKGMISALKDKADCLAWNYRTCGSHFTNSNQLYHNGKIDDLNRIISHSLNQYDYQKIILVGFSMGGNLNLLYLGKSQEHSDRIDACISISGAIDLANSTSELEKGLNYFYMKRFLKKLKLKLQKKKEQFPDLIDLSDYDKIRSFREFDNRYTAPLHGFLNAADYWEKCSSIFHLSHIKCPTLLLSAYDDTFLGDRCYPDFKDYKNKHIVTHYTQHGGHVGFINSFNMKRTFAEVKSIEFLDQYIFS